MRTLFDHPLARARAGIILLLLLPLTSPVTGVMGDRVFATGVVHMLLVSVMTAAALVVAVLASRAAWMRHDLRSALVASGFSAMCSLLLVHGLATPGGLLFAGFVPTVQVAGVMAIPVGAVFLLAAMVVPPRVEGGRQRIVLIQGATLLGCLAFAIVGLIAPGVMPAIPLMEEPYSTWVLGPTILLFAWAALRAHRVADITRRGGDAAMFAGLLVLAEAVFIYVTSAPFNAQFWFGHVLEVVGFALVSAAIASDLRRPVSSWRLTTQADGETLFASSEELLGGYVHALTVTLSQVDPSTWNHSRRVAELAVAVGEELQLDPATIRRIAVAGLVHDIGKLRIPHSVLHKAGKLSDEEFDLIKGHPDFGVELLSHLRGFEAELGIVLGHHEKLSGRGYPQGLQGDEIDLETRIMTACDVYDALTDSRSYKEPWPIEKAVALLHQESGESFDPVVVSALERVVTRRAAATAPLPDNVVPIGARVPAIRPIDTPAGLIEGGDDAAVWNAA